jgi:hypothetical protein
VEASKATALAAWIMVRRLSIQPPYPADSHTKRATNKAESTSTASRSA